MVSREVLAYMPELSSLVKTAEETENFSVSSPSQALFSYLKVGYMIKVAGLEVEPEQIAYVNKAIKLYGIEKQADEILSHLETRFQIKQANVLSEEETKRDLSIAQDTFDTMRQGFVNQERLTKIARALYDGHSDDIVSDSIKQYACIGYLEKQAAERALKARFRATSNPTFEKLASVLDNMDISKFSTDEKRQFADFIYGLDKEAGLTVKGFNIYEEVFMTKKAMASTTIVNLTPGKSVPVESIMRIAPDLVDALGADLVRELTKTPEDVRQVVESLPLDLKAILARYC